MHYIYVRVENFALVKSSTLEFLHHNSCQTCERWTEKTLALKWKQATIPCMAIWRYGHFWIDGSRITLSSITPTLSFTYWRLGSWRISAVPASGLTSCLGAIVDKSALYLDASTRREIIFWRPAQLRFLLASDSSTTMPFKIITP